MSTASPRRYTAERARFVFGQDMQPCPACGSYHLGFSTPIKLDGPLADTADGILRQWAKARRAGAGAGATPLEGTCRIMCRDCGHIGPAVDVTGRTAEDVGKDPEVAAETKRRWNRQKTHNQPEA